MKAIETKTQKQPAKPHFLHHHRPVVSMGLGISILLAIMVLTLANSKPFQEMQIQTVPQGDQKLGLFAKPSSWPTYTATNSTLSFRYPKGWQVTEKKLDKDSVVYISATSEGQAKILIYTSPQSFLGFEGLPAKEQNLNGYKATYIDSSLFGIKKGSFYYTFDASLSSDVLPAFAELANSIKIE